MIDQKFVDYINQQLKNGYDIETIRNTMIQRGYDQNTVNESVEYVKNPQSSGTNTANANPNNASSKINMSNPQYVGFWARVGAWILDCIIIGLPAGALQYGLALVTGMPSMMYIVSGATVILWIYFEGVHGGTPGKLILDMRVVNEKGEYIGMPLAFLRYIGRLISGLILGIGFFMIGWDEKKQGLHDKIAKTYVVRK
jgi:uncharacterized RDD family membrane protein YckC